jgi:N-methylhydantoinase B
MFREYRLLAEGSASSAAGCGESGPFGGNGGMPGGRYQITLAGNSGRPKKLPPLTPAQPFSNGDILRVETPGGGGWGDPSGRDPEAVRLDVMRGLVSRDAAKNIYRVALGRAPEVRVDEEETRKLRKKKK